MKLTLLEDLKLEVLAQMQDLLEEKLLQIHMEVGVLMEVEHLVEKTHLKLTDPLHIIADTLQNRLLQMV